MIETVYNKNSDLAKLKRFITSGDEDYFVDIITRYKKMVYSACYSRLRNDADAQDATQQVFLKLLKHADSIESNLSSWLYMCAKNTSISMIRSNKTRQNHERQSSIIRQSDHNIFPKEQLEETVDFYLKKLPPENRELIIQKYILGLSQKVIAKKYGMSQQAISKKLRQILTKLARHHSKSRLGLLLAGILGSIKATKTYAALKASAISAKSKVLYCQDIFYNFSCSDKMASTLTTSMVVAVSFVSTQPAITEAPIKNTVATIVKSSSLSSSSTDEPANDITLMKYASSQDIKLVSDNTRSAVSLQELQTVKSTPTVSGSSLAANQVATQDINYRQRVTIASAGNISSSENLNNSVASQTESVSSTNAYVSLKTSYSPSEKNNSTETTDQTVDKQDMPEGPFQDNRMPHPINGDASRKINSPMLPMADLATMPFHSKMQMPFFSRSPQDSFEFQYESLADMGNTALEHTGYHFQGQLPFFGQISYDDSTILPVEHSFKTIDSEAAENYFPGPFLINDDTVALIYDQNMISLQPDIYEKEIAIADIPFECPTENSLDTIGFIRPMAFSSCTPITVMAVPEPAGILILSIMSLGILKRRKK